MNNIIVFSHSYYSKYALLSKKSENYNIRTIDNRTLKYLPLWIIFKLKIYKLFSSNFLKNIYFQVITFLLFGRKLKIPKKVLVFEFSWISQINGYIDFIKKNRRNLILIYFLTNEISKKDFEVKKPIFDSFDYVFTYSERDAKSFNFIHVNIPLDFSKIKFPRNCKSKYQVYFNGRNKGRLSNLLKISTILNEFSINHKFCVVSKNAQKRIDNNSNVKVYMRQIKYEKILIDTYCSEILLDLYSDNLINSRSYTLRLIEAVNFNKRVITNNKMILKEAYYDESLILVFNDIDDLRNKIQPFLSIEKKQCFNREDVYKYMPNNLLNIISNLPIKGGI